MSGGASLNDGPVGRALWSVSAPLVLGMLAALSVGVADSWFLGRVGEDALAAVGFIYPVVTGVSALSIGVAAGATTVISTGLGRGGGGAEAEADRAGVQALVLGTVFAALVAVLFLTVDAWVFALLGAEGAVLEIALSYTPFWALAFPFGMAAMLIGAILRSHGMGVLAGAVMSVGALLNVALDPLFIFGWGPVPAMGAAGAAMATFAAQAVAAAWGVGLLWRRGLARTGGHPITHLGVNAQGLARVGGPAAIANAIDPLGMAIVTAAVALVSTSAVAGFGVAVRVQGLVIVPMLALAAGIGPVVGQAWGAGDHDRARRAVRTAAWGCLAYGAGLAIVLILAADPIARTFGAGPEASEAAAAYLRWVGWSFGPFGLMLAVNAALDARDRALRAMIVSTSRILAIFVPLAWLGAATTGYGGVLGAALAANAAGAWGALAMAERSGLLGTGWRVFGGTAADRSSRHRSPT